MTVNVVDPGQIPLSEASYSGSLLFSDHDISGFIQQDNG